MTDWLNLASNDREVREEGNLLTGWLKRNPRVNEVREEGSLFTGWLKRNPRVKEVRERGSLFIGWSKLCPKVNEVMGGEGMVTRARRMRRWWERAWKSTGCINSPVKVREETERGRETGWELEFQETLRAPVGIESIDFVITLRGEGTVVNFSPSGILFENKN